MINVHPLALKIIRLQQQLENDVRRLSKHLIPDRRLETFKRQVNNLGLNVGLVERRSELILFIEAIKSRFQKHIAQIIILYLLEPEWFKNQKFVVLMWTSDGFNEIFHGDITGKDVTQVLCDDRFQGDHINMVKKLNSFFKEMQHESATIDIQSELPSKIRFSYYFFVDTLGTPFLALIVRFRFGEAFGGIICSRCDFPLCRMNQAFTMIKKMVHVKRSEPKILTRVKTLRRATLI